MTNVFLFNFYVLNFKAELNSISGYETSKSHICFLVRRKNISLCVSIKKDLDVSEITKMFSTIKIIVK